MKNDLPYFSHNNNARRHPKMKALIAEFGFEGYGRFWAICERVAEDSGAYIDISKKVNKLDLAGELGFNGSELDAFLSFLADPEINLINLENGVITIDRITKLFEETMSQREDWRNKWEKKKKAKTGESAGGEGERDSPEGERETPRGASGEKGGLPCGASVKQTKQNKQTKQDPCGSEEPPFSDPPFENPDLAEPKEPPGGKDTGKPKKPPLREREPENAHEIVEKAYRLNWDRLRAEGKVRTRDPVVNWRQARKLLTAHFAAEIPPEKIVEAINNGLKDDFVMRKGYSLAMMLSATVLNGLLNSTGPPKGSPHRIASDEIAGDEWQNYFRDDLDASLGEAV